MSGWTVTSKVCSSRAKQVICQFSVDVACGILYSFPPFFFSFPTSNFYNALILLPFFTLAR